jgi:hypothetical protein
MENAVLVFGRIPSPDFFGFAIFNLQSRAHVNILLPQSRTQMGPTFLCD